MKRIVAAVFAFVAVLCIGIVNSVYFDKVCGETLSIVNESIRLAEEGSFSAARETAQTAENFWEGRRGLLVYTVNHGFLYEVDARLTGLSALSTEDAKEEFLASAEQAAEALTYVMSDK